MTQPLVSVLTPSYNQVRWLADNLRSVAAQSYPAIEHVVMDGGSSDGSLEVLASASPAVVWESAPDEGQPDAINKAFSRSTGQIIGWLNSDDAYFAPDVVEHAVELLVRSPRVDVVYGHAALVAADGRVLHAMWAPPYSRRVMRTYNFISQPTVFMRREILGDTLVDEHFDCAMDRELWLRLASKGCRFARLHRIVAIDRHQPGRKMYTRLDEAGRDERVLGARYSVPVGRLHAGRRKALKIAFRLQGISLIPELLRAELAFSGYRDGRIQTLIRQAALPRVMMAFEGGGAR